MIPNLVDFFSGNIGSTKNDGVGNIEDVLYSSKAGKIVISPKNSPKASAIMISEDGVRITGGSTATGFSVKDGGVAAQGVLTITGSGENIHKSNYSENPKSNRIFTYQETIVLESIPKELSSKMSGYTTGSNISSGMDGVFPIVTDFEPGPLLHAHTISMKHVHRVDPSYLYRIPQAVSFIAGALKELKQFSKLA